MTVKPKCTYGHCNNLAVWMFPTSIDRLDPPQYVWEPLCDMHVKTVWWIDEVRGMQKPIYGCLEI